MTEYPPYIFKENPSYQKLEKCFNKIKYSHLKSTHFYRTYYGYWKKIDPYIHNIWANINYLDIMSLPQTKESLSPKLYEIIIKHINRYVKEIKNILKSSRKYLHNNPEFKKNI